MKKIQARVLDRWGGRRTVGSDKLIDPVGEPRSRLNLFLSLVEGVVLQRAPTPPLGAKIARRRKTLSTLANLYVIFKLAHSQKRFVIFKRPCS